MITYELREQIARNPQRVFDFVGTRCCQNHPRWETAVLELRQVTPGPIGVGTRLMMVRQDGRRRHEVPEEVIAFVPGRAVARRTLAGPLALRIDFNVSPGGAVGAELKVRVQAELRGFLRLLQPMFAARMPRDGSMMMRRIKELIEAES
jgi:hypothetical protein